MKSKKKISKARKVIDLVILSIAVFYLVFNFINNKTEYSKMSFNDKILYAVNDLEFEDVIIADKILLLQEVKDGYVCVVSESNDSGVHFCYIKKDKDELLMLGETTSSKILYIKNNLYSSYNRLHISNFSKEHFYFNCYVHNEEIAKVFANNEELVIHHFQLEHESVVYDMDFWFVRSENPPEIKIEKSDAKADYSP